MDPGLLRRLRRTATRDTLGSRVVPRVRLRAVGGQGNGAHRKVHARRLPALRCGDIAEEGDSRLNDLLAALKREGKCCACEGSMKKTRHLNMVALDKRATWGPALTWGNVLIDGSHGRAVAVLCDFCVVGGRPKSPKFALERTGGMFVYHPIADLEDLPEITEEQVEEGERRVFPR